MVQPLYIFGEVLFDCFPDGREVLGGAPFDVAWHLQAFGQSPVLISSVGDDDAGRHIREAMSAWGMRLDALQVDQAHPTGRVTVTLDGGEPNLEAPGLLGHSHLYPPHVGFRESEVRLSCPRARRDDE